MSRKFTDQECLSRVANAIEQEEPVDGDTLDVERICATPELLGDKINRLGREALRAQMMRDNTAGIIYRERMFSTNDGTSVEVCVFASGDSSPAQILDDALDLAHHCMSAASEFFDEADNPNVRCYSYAWTGKDGNPRDVLIRVTRVEMRNRTIS